MIPTYRSAAAVHAADFRSNRVAAAVCQFDRVANFAAQHARRVFALAPLQDQRHALAQGLAIRVEAPQLRVLFPLHLAQYCCSADSG